MTNRRPPKRTASVRVTDDIWNIIDEVAIREGWTRNIAIQEIVKYYAKQNNIIVLKEENEHEGT